ncbi:hypothetical protein Q9233_003901 [Columba guinea]|nr:hypothetical protein Q9233_003901 [Columba guinea]
MYFISRTPLHLACANGHADVVRFLAGKKCKLNPRGMYKKTPLMLAVQHQHKDCVTALLEHGADADRKGAGGNTALHMAALMPSKAMVELLLEHNAQIDARNDGDDFSFQLGYTPLAVAIVERREEMVEFLLENGADVNARDIHQSTVLFFLIETRTASQIWLIWMSLLLGVLPAAGTAQEDDDESLSDSENFWMPCCFEVQNNKERVRILLQRSATMDFALEREELPLKKEASTQTDGQGDTQEWVRWLQQELASALRKCSLAEASLEAEKRHSRDLQEQKLQLQKELDSSKAQLQELKERLIRNECYAESLESDIKNKERELTAAKNLQGLLVTSSGTAAVPELEERVQQTPLHLACANGHADVVRFLAGKKCKLNPRGMYKKTPLMLAVQHQHKDCVTALLEHGADADRKGAGGNTALHMAALMPSKAMVELLLEHNAQIDARNDLGYTPLAVAIVERREEMVEFLLENGADVNARDIHQSTVLFFLIETRTASQIWLILMSLLLGVLPAAGAAQEEEDFDFSSLDEDFALEREELPLKKEASTQTDGQGDTQEWVRWLQQELASALRKCSLAEASLEAEKRHSRDLQEQKLQLQKELDSSKAQLQELKERLIRNECYAESLESDIKNKERELTAAKNLQGLLVTSSGTAAVPELEERVQQTPLHLACANGHADVVRFLAGKKCKLNPRGMYKKTPLMLAVQHQHKDCVTALLEHGADADRKGAGGNTALHMAALMPSKAMVELLLEHNAQIDARNDLGYTPLAVAIVERREEMVEFLLENGADVNARDIHQRTPLKIAGYAGNTNVVRLLLQHGAVLSHRDENGFTDMAYLDVFTPGRIPKVQWNCAMPSCFQVQNNKERVRILLQRSATMNFWMPCCFEVQNNKERVRILLQRSATMEWVRWLQRELASALRKCFLAEASLEAEKRHSRDLQEQKLQLQKELDSSKAQLQELKERLIRNECYAESLESDIKNKERELTAAKNLQGLLVTSSGTAAVPELEERVQQTPLHLACANGHADVVRFLAGKKCKLNPRGMYKKTPLMLAVQHQHKDCVTALLEHGADADRKGAGGNTALHMAALMPSKAMVELLLEHNAQIDAQNDLGYTPLAVAIVERREEMVEFLLENGADVNARDIHQRTPLKIAGYAGNTNVVRLLLQHGAVLSHRDENGFTDMANLDVFTPGPAAERQCDAAVLLRIPLLTVCRSVFLLAQDFALEREELPLKKEASTQTDGQGDTQEWVRWLQRELASALRKCSLAEASLEAEKRHSRDLQEQKLQLQKELDSSKAQLQELKERLIRTECYAESLESDIKNKERELTAAKNLQGLLVTSSGTAAVPELEERVQQTPLHLACANGHADVVRFLAGKKCKLNPRGMYKKTPLMLAVQHQHKDCVTALLEHGADADRKGAGGNTALHMAALMPSKAMVELLLEHNAQIDARNDLGYTPLAVAIVERREEMVEFLLENGADVNARDIHQSTVLFFLIETRTASQIWLIWMSLLLGVLPAAGTAQEDDDESLSDSEQELASALRKCSLAEASLEAEKRHSRDLQEQKLQLQKELDSSKAQLQELKERLIRNECYAKSLESDIKNKERELTAAKNLQGLLVTSSGTAAVPELEERVQQTPLHLACANGHADVVRFLAGKKCKLNPRGMYKKTPLMLAVQHQHKDCVTALLEHGADADRKGAGGNTALHMAALMPSKAMVELLLEHNAQIDARNDLGYTPLAVAIVERREEMVEFLLENGADVNARDIHQRTPLKIAGYAGNTNVVRLLLQHGAVLSHRDENGFTDMAYLDVFTPGPAAERQCDAAVLLRIPLLTVCRSVFLLAQDFALEREELPLKKEASTQTDGQGDTQEWVRWLQQELASALRKCSLAEASLEAEKRHSRDLQEQKLQLQKELDSSKAQLQELKERLIRNECYAESLESDIKNKERELTAAKNLQGLLVTSSGTAAVPELEERVQQLQVRRARLAATVQQQAKTIEALQQDLQASASVS